MLRYALMRHWLESHEQSLQAPSGQQNSVTSAVQVRRDNPRLTTRREGGHAPVRMVMSRTLDLPQVAISEYDALQSML